MTKAGEKIIEGLNEALAIARGEQPAGAIWHNGFRYVPDPPWQPIDTAPKTGGGRAIWGNGSGGPPIIVTDGTGIYFAFWNGRSWDDGDYNNDLGEMTHWRPMLETPNELAAKRGSEPDV